MLHHIILYIIKRKHFSPLIFLSYSSICLILHCGRRTGKKERYEKSSLELAIN